MNYTIFSIDDSRSQYTARLREQLEWKEVRTVCVTGRNSFELLRAMKRHGYEVNFPTALVGQLGIWYTVLNALDHAPVVTFEDDAILHKDFHYVFEERQRFIPDDFDFFSLFVPRDSDHIYYNDASRYNLTDDPTPVVRAYQPYGGVSMYYSEKGAGRIKDLLKRDGITAQYDDQLYKYAQTGELNGYTSSPRVPDLVRISSSELSIVQNTEAY